MLGTVNLLASWFLGSMMRKRCRKRRSLLIASWFSWLRFSVPISSVHDHNVSHWSYWNNFGHRFYGFLWTHRFLPMALRRIYLWNWARVFAIASTFGSVASSYLWRGQWSSYWIPPLFSRVLFLPPLSWTFRKNRQLLRRCAKDVFFVVFLVTTIHNVTLSSSGLWLKEFGKSFGQSQSLSQGSQPCGCEVRASQWMSNYGIK